MVKILIIGSTGMLGYTLLRHLVQAGGFEVHATMRSHSAPAGFQAPSHSIIHGGIDASDQGTVRKLIHELRPHEVINCVGLIKQLSAANDPEASIRINALFPHVLAGACSETGGRLIHFSTDCVFDGCRGNYSEDAPADADDLYGRCKRLGEVTYGRHLTIRTSLIGHELRPGVSLIDWFLAQRRPVAGFSKAIFSGFPTVEVARILAMNILRDGAIHGLFHLASNPISKLDLLRKVREIYGHPVDIEPTDTPAIDRSLDGRRLSRQLGYQAPDWDRLLKSMHADYLSAYWPLRQSMTAAE